MERTLNSGCQVMDCELAVPPQQGDPGDVMVM